MLGSDCIQEGQRQALQRALDRADGVGGDAVRIAISVAILRSCAERAILLAMM